MWEVLLAIRHHGCPVSDTSADNPEVHLENLSKAKTGDGRAKRLICLRGAASDINQFATEFRSHKATEKFNEISRQNNGRIGYFSSEIRYNHENPSVLSIINEEGCYQHSSVCVKYGIEHWVIYTEQKESVGLIVDRIQQLDNKVELDKTADLGHVSNGQPIEYTTILTSLTPQQQAAFEAALGSDYYNNESDTTIDDIADELDIHQSTAWEHVKKAENKILTNIGKRLFKTPTKDQYKSLVKHSEY